MSITYLELVLIFSTKFHIDPSVLNIQLTIRKLKIPHFFNCSSPSSPPNSRIEETTIIKSICAGPWHTYQFSSSLHVQKHRTRQSIVNPQLHQRKRIQSSYVNHVSRTCAYSSHHVSPRSLHSKHFPRFAVSRFPFPPSPPPLLCLRIRFKSKM